MYSIAYAYWMRVALFCLYNIVFYCPTYNYICNESDRLNGRFLLNFVFEMMPLYDIEDYSSRPTRIATICNELSLRVPDSLIIIICACVNTDHYCTMHTSAYIPYLSAVIDEQRVYALRVVDARDEN